MRKGEGTRSLGLLAKSITTDGDVMGETTALCKTAKLVKAFKKVMIAIDY